MLNKPITAIDTLRAAPPFNVVTPRRPRLTVRGKVLVVMAVAFGAVAALVSLAMVVRIAGAGVSAAAMPAIVMASLIDLVPIGFVVLLHRTYRLLLAGQFATGVVVSATVGGIKSWGVTYDFLDGKGQVIRGRSLRSFYTVALARAFDGATLGDYFGIGSYVPVLYRADNPARNALYVSYAWEI
jgi:hypothetical protein